MAQTVALDIQINSEEGAKSLRTLKQEFKSIQTELDNISVGTDEYKSKLQQLANVKDQIDDLNDAIASQTGAGKFEAFAKVGSAIAGGFSAAQGAMALFGAESEDLQKSLMKVQAAMAIAQGIGQLEDLSNAWKNFKSVALAALQAIKAGIGATGIGLLVIALGTIVAYWDDIKAAVNGVSAEEKKLLETQKQSVKAAADKLDSISKQENILRLQGKTEKEILQMKQKATAEEIKALEAQLLTQETMKKEQIETAKRNKEILQGIITFLTLPLSTLLKTIDYVGTALGKNFGLYEKFTGGIAKLVFDPEETAKEGDKTIAETKAKLLELKNAQAGYQLDINKIDKEAADKRRQEAEKNKKDETLHWKGKYEEMQIIQKDFVENSIKLNDELKKSSIDMEAEREKALLNLINSRKNNNQSSYESELELLELRRDKILNDETKGLNDRIAAEIEFNKKKEELDNAEAARKEKAIASTFNVTKDSLKSVADLVTAFAGESEKEQKKAFEFQKGVNIANATIDTYTSAVAAYKSLIGTPIVGPVIAPLAAAAAVAAGIANIRKIEQQTFKGSGTPSNSGAGGGTFSPSLSAPVTNTATNLSSIGFGQEQEPVKVFVTETDITGIQNKINKIEATATIK